jgi:Flp pilus assembly protein TadG
MNAEKAFNHMRGLASVELAVVAPVFLVMLFSIIEFGVVLYDKAIITNASLQLAQAGSSITTTSKTSPPTPTDIATVVAAVKSPATMATVLGTSLVSVGGSSQPTVIATVGTWDGLGYPLTVTVTYQYQSLVLASVIQLVSSWNLANGIPVITKTSVYIN